MREENRPVSAPTMALSEGAEEDSEEVLSSLVPPESVLEALFSPLLWRYTLSLMVLFLAPGCAQFCAILAVQDGVTFTEKEQRGTADTPSLLLMISVPILSLGFLILANQMVVRVGRRTAAASFFGVLSFTLLFSSLSTAMRNLLVFTALLVRILSTASFVIAHLMLLELMPTVARGSALGLCYTILHIGKFGTLLTFEALGISWAALFVAILAGVGAALAYFVFPDTRGIPLPDVLPEVDLELFNEYLGIDPEGNFSGAYDDGGPEIEMSTQAMMEMAREALSPIGKGLGVSWDSQDDGGGSPGRRLGLGGLDEDAEDEPVYR